MYTVCDNEKPDGSCAGHEIEQDPYQIMPPEEIEALAAVVEQEGFIHLKMWDLLEEDSGWELIIKLLVTGTKTVESVQNHLVQMTTAGLVPEQLAIRRLIHGLAWRGLAQMVLERQKQLDEQRKAEDAKSK